MFEGSSQAPWYDGLSPFLFLGGYAVFVIVAAVLGLMVLWRIYRLLGLHIKLTKRRLEMPVALESAPVAEPQP